MKEVEGRIKELEDEMQELSAPRWDWDAPDEGGEYLRTEHALKDSITTA